MEINQKRNSNRIRYEFGEDELHYHLKDSSGSRAFSVAYTDTSRDRQTLEERNAWLRNVGLLWIALGLVITVANWHKGVGTVPSIWLVLGIGTWIVYHFRTTRFIIVPSDKGNLLVIDDDDGKRILREIKIRRAAKFRREYDFMSENETPEQRRSRFKWLHSEGVLSEEELQSRLAMIAADVPPVEAAIPPQKSLLN